MAEDHDDSFRQDYEATMRFLHVTREEIMDSAMSNNLSRDHHLDSMLAEMALVQKIRDMEQLLTEQWADVLNDAES